MVGAVGITALWPVQTINFLGKGGGDTGGESERKRN